MDLHKIYNLLHKAQNTYGYPNQIMVATEELCELAAVLSKYPRYPDHTTASENLREKILDEVSDVNIILIHLYMIFNFTPQEIEGRMEAKLKRLERWLKESPDMYQTTKDRGVE